MKCRNPVAVICGTSREYTDFESLIWKEHRKKFRMVIPDRYLHFGGVEFSGHIVIGTADAFEEYEKCVLFIRAMTRWPNSPVGCWDMGPLG